MGFFEFIKENWWVVLLIVIGSIWAVYSSPEEKEKRNLKKETAEKERQKKIEYKEKYDLEEDFYNYKHLYGLNIPENTSCDLWLCKECLIFYYSTPIVLNYSKIITAEIFSHKQVKKQYVDNTTGAIAGGLAFGAVGAILGGGTKTVYDTEKTQYLAITYKNGDDMQSVVFDVTDKSMSFVKDFVLKLKIKLADNSNEVIEL